MPFEILHVALVLLRGRFAAEGSEISALASLWTFLAGIEAVFAAAKFSNHSTFARFAHGGIF
jgi:hypothetical protein